MRVLIWSELYKLVHQRMTYLALLAILIIEGVVIFSAYFQGNTILDLLLENLRDSFYFEGNLLNGHLLVYLILNSLWFHLPLILMIVSAGLLTTEYKDKTLQMVMLQPINRASFLISKYVVAIIFSLSVVLLLIATSMGVSYAIFGGGDLVVYLGSLNFFTDQDAFERILWAYACGSLTVVFFSVVSVTIAVLVRETTIAWIASAFFLIVTNLLLKVDFGDNWVGKYSFVKLNDTWQQLFYQDINWTQIHINNGLLIGYTILFMIVGVIVFNRRDLV
jgi:ABC-2 type transport system permease protein